LGHVRKRNPVAVRESLLQDDAVLHCPGCSTGVAAIRVGGL
jgi:hypothetical protein